MASAGEHDLVKHKYYRDSAQRVFVNKSVHMEKIRFLGFDMDYTLAEYKSPDYEKLGFQMLCDRLVEVGYPEQIRQFEYDPTFPLRGLWYDKQYGNILKVDAYGNILTAMHGLTRLKWDEVHEKYPNKFIANDPKVYIYNTLFNLPEIHFMACLVDFFTNSDDYKNTAHGFKFGDVFMSFSSIFHDVRQAMDYIHGSGDLKKKTLEDLNKYVVKDERLPLLLTRIQESGRKPFLLTNSDWWYTNHLMSYLLNDGSKNWESYFNFIICDASKPSFFMEGSALRKVSKETGKLQIGIHTGNMKEGHVYSGGNCENLSKMIGASGRDVLYFGDHIFGDVLKSKKLRGWKTCFIVPELNNEMGVWTEKQQLFSKLEDLDITLGDLYKNMDSSATSKPDVRFIRKSMQEVVHEMEKAYGVMGSVFRSGSRQTYFSSQVVRYADLYAPTILNLLNYPFTYMFRAPPMLMPHETTSIQPSTVDGMDDEDDADERNSNSSN